MAMFIRPAVVGDTTAVHAALSNRLGLEAEDDRGRVWLYLRGCAGCDEGSWVIYNDLAETHLLIGSMVGPVAVAGAAIPGEHFGWFCVQARLGVYGRLMPNTQPNRALGFMGISGVVGDGASPRNGIFGAVCRTATADQIVLGTVQLCDPSVNDMNSFVVF
jgi:hypothetical protein